MTPAPGMSIVMAAGGILSRGEPDRERILLVHRNRYGDWTLPKGKLDANETLQEAAIREVREETGCVVKLGDFAGVIGYEVNYAPKVVFFWRMTIVSEEAFTDRREVDRTEWMDLNQAIERLTYDRERSLVSSLFALNDRPGGASEGFVLRLFRRNWSWSRSDRSRSRLQREFEAFRVGLAHIERRSRTADGAWVSAAWEQLENVKRYIHTGDIEGGWYCLHAAQRLSLFGLPESELEDQARVLGAEAGKLSSWRKDAVKELLKPTPLTPERVGAAMALRDEYGANQYHKIWLMADQLRVLLWISSAALAALMTLLWKLPEKTSIWDYRLLATVVCAGILGAAFSAAQGLISNQNPTKIPERVANNLVTTVRSVFGATAGLAGYVFLKSKLLLNISIGDDSDAIGTALAIAFLFGYTGERLIARIADTLGKEGERS